MFWIIEHQENQLDDHKVEFLDLFHDVYEDSKLPSLFPRKHYLDIVDDAWIIDTLSDDEIELSPALDLDLNGSDGEPPMWTGDEKVDHWNDLGLDQWVRDTA
ncbi:hypothetical protein KXD40_007755 [Peronospora effusa]|uniref:Anaphase-promoting complex subunit 13 n=1 Tax=Peronospora effusa TaxID=542832 RepID=A0A3R7XDP5_9STRA|nr:hypothetical protein DD237_000816 [Peronospora effusa]UIZ23591.1 hypothetical protein KXD40_007755 [Peronospora effusa]